MQHLAKQVLSHLFFFRLLIGCFFNFKAASNKRISAVRHLAKQDDISGTSVSQSQYGHRRTDLGAEPVFRASMKHFCFCPSWQTPRQHSRQQRPRWSYPLDKSDINHRKCRCLTSKTVIIKSLNWSGIWLKPFFTFVSSLWPPSLNVLEQAVSKTTEESIL